MILIGMAAFVVEIIGSTSPNMDPGKETKQRCPLCHEEKKLKELRGHIGLHILWRSFGVEEDLVTKVGSLPPCLIPGADVYARLGIILADSAVATSATLTSSLPEVKDRLNQIAGFAARSSTARPRSPRKTHRAQMSQSTVLTAQRRFGSTTPLTISRSDTRTFLTVLVSTPILFSRFSPVRTKRR